MMGIEENIEEIKRKFYYPLQDKAEDLDRVVHDLVEITDDEESIDKVVKIENKGTEEEPDLHFVAGEAGDKQKPIEVDSREVPVGDGDNWVEPSEWYAQVGVSEYNPDDDNPVTLSFSTEEAEFTISKFQIENEDSEINDLLTEDFLNGLKVNGYTGYLLTETQIEQIKSLFVNGELFDANICFGSINDFTSPYYTTSYCKYGKVYQDNEKLKIKIISYDYNSSYDGENWTYTLKVSAWRSTSCSKEISFLGDERLIICVDKIVKFTIPLVARQLELISEPNQDLEIKREKYFVDETRYFGSQFTTSESVYTPQIVFGNDPKGVLGFNNSCNLTLRGKAKIIGDDSSWAHFAHGSKIELYNNSEILGKEDGKLWLVGGWGVIGQKGRSSNEKGKYHLFDGYGPNLLISDHCHLQIEGGGNLSIKDDCDLFMEDHAWLAMSGESRVSLDGYSRFHMSAGSSYSTGGPCSNHIIADTHRFAFQSIFKTEDNSPIKSGNIVGPVFFKVGSQIDPVKKHYRSEAEVPYISSAHQYVPSSEYMSTFKTDLDNSIVFIGILSGYWYSDLDQLNNQLQALLPDYSIKMYYLFSNQGVLNTVLDFLNENPSYKNQLTNFIERQYPYFTEEEFNLFQSFPSSPYFNYSLVKSLAPIAAKQDRSFANIIEQLNSLPFFDIEYKLEGQYVLSDLYLFSQNSYKSNLNYILDKDMSDPRLVYYNYDYKTNYSCHSMDNYFDSKQYYCVVTPYDPTNPASGSYIVPSLAEELEGKMIFDGNGVSKRETGTTFLFGGPNASAVIEGQGTTNIRIGGYSESYIGFDITSGGNSVTNFKIGANNRGEVNYFLTGDDLFIEYSDRAHIEVHDNSNFILSGMKASTSKALIDDPLTLGHHDELWTVPKKNSSNTSPTLQLYHGSSFSMYGRLSDTSLMKIGSEIRGQIQVDTITLLTLQNSQRAENQKYVKGAQFLLNYIDYYNEPQDRTEDVIIIDRETLFSIMDLYMLFNKNEHGNKYLETMVRDVIEFTEIPQNYSVQSEYLPSGAQTAVFTVESGKKYGDSQYNWIFNFKVQNCLSGINDTYRMNKIANSPLCEIADNAEFRMWGDTVFKIDDNGITLTDSTGTVTFTAAQLAAIIASGIHTNMTTIAGDFISTMENANRGGVIPFTPNE